MIRERIGRAALRAYPPQSRAARGEEMLGTLLDAGEGSSSALARESASLLLAGLRERTALTAGAGSRRLIADACPQAIAILTLWLLRNGLLDEIGRYPASGRLALALIVLFAVLTCSIVGYDRIAGLAGLALCAGILLFADQHAPLLTRSVALALTIVPAICFAVMALAPRKRPPDPLRLLWLAPAAALVAIMHSSGGGLAFLAVISLAALLRLPTDPRFALACGLAWAALGMGDIAVALSLEHAPSSVWTASTAGATVMLAIALTRLRLMRRVAQS
jgi:hypothetical protein